MLGAGEKSRASFQDMQYSIRRVVMDAPAGAIHGCYGDPGAIWAIVYLVVATTNRQCESILGWHDYRRRPDLDLNFVDSTGLDGLRGPMVVVGTPYLCAIFVDATHGKPEPTLGERHCGVLRSLETALVAIRIEES